jgi:GGDEF domain-containing protein
MNSLPTTDDLRYMLSTAKEHRKMVELPFKNGQYANSFTVRLIPPTGQIGPKWSLHRGEHDSSPAIWTRESSEVMMIQNKIKIDSMSASLAQDAAEPISHQSQSHTSLRSTTTNSGLPAFGGEGLTAPSNPPPFVPPQGAWGPSPIAGPAPNQSYSQLQAMSQGGWSPDSGTALSAPQAGQQPAWLPGSGTAPPAPAPSTPDFSALTAQPVAHGAPETYADLAARDGSAASQAQLRNATPPMQQSSANSTFSQMQPVQQGGWVPKTGGRTMPPPAALDPDIIRDTMEELADPTSGLTYYRAFTFFLAKEFERHKKFKTKLALLVFDFAKGESNELIQLSDDELQAVASILHSACSHLDECTRMDSGEYAVMMSGYGSTDALNFSEELWVKLASDERLVRLALDSRTLAIGVSSIPEVCADPGLLIATAQEAKATARKNSNPCSLFSLF